MKEAPAPLLKFEEKNIELVYRYLAWLKQKESQKPCKKAKKPAKTEDAKTEDAKTFIKLRKYK